MATSQVPARDPGMAADPQDHRGAYGIPADHSRNLCLRSITELQVFPPSLTRGSFAAAGDACRCAFAPYATG